VNVKQIFVLIFAVASPLSSWVHIRTVRKRWMLERPTPGTWSTDEHSLFRSL